MSTHTRRFRAAGRVRLMLGSVEAIPAPPDSFTRAVAVNSFHHWESREAGLTELRRVLRPGGLLVLVLRREHPTRTRLVAPGHSLEEIEAAERLLTWLGYRDIRRQTRRLGREAVGLLVRG